MADEVTYITDGESHCRIVDPTSGTIQAPLRQISLGGALIDTKEAVEAESALDLTVVLKGLQPRQFFAQVVSSGSGGLQLQWMPIDAGEQARLKSLLEAYRTLHKPGGPPPPSAPTHLHEKTATRRLIKPSSTAIEPFSEPPSPPQGSPVASGPTTLGGTAKRSTATSERVRTRRVVRPSQGNLPRVQDIAPFADEARAAPAASSSNILPEAREDSGSQVAIAATPSGGTPVLPATTPSGGTPTVGGGAQDDSKGTPVIGSDGRMDIGASIRSRAKSVKASDLAARHEHVRVLNMGTIKSLIQEAVEEASHHLTRSLSEADRKRLLEEAEEGFKERLKAFEAEKLSAEARMKRLADQLALAQQTLEDERKRTIKADQFTVSATGLDEIESKFKRLLEHSIAEGRVVPALEEELRKVIATVFDQERQRIREQELKAQNEKIQLLETKIKRLATSLEDTERQRDEMQEWARMIEAQGGGLRNVFTPGLKGDDPNKKRKLALMKEILEVNRSIRKELGLETTPVDAETQEAIKKVEAEAVLTAEEQAEILERRKRIEEEPAAKPDAEMRNVMAEAGGEVDAGDASDAGASDSDADEPTAAADDEAWDEARDKVKVRAGAVKVTADGTQELQEGAEIDPDDLPWEASSAAQNDEDDAGSVKKIKIDTNFKLPPMERS